VSGCAHSYRRINQIEPLIEQTRHAKLTAVPAVVQFDGIWLREQTPTPMLKPDTRGRKRQQHTGKKVVVLVALVVTDRWEWQTRDLGLAGRFRGGQSLMGNARQSIMGTWTPA
jgi:hypothetical protein